MVMALSRACSPSLFSPETLFGVSPTHLGFCAFVFQHLWGFDGFHESFDRISAHPAHCFQLTFNACHYESRFNVIFMRYTLWMFYCKIVFSHFAVSFHKRLDFVLLRVMERYLAKSGKTRLSLADDA